MRLPILVRVAIELNNQAALRTTEVSDITCDSVLPAKLQAVEPPAPQARPKDLLRRSLLTAHIASKLKQLRINSVLAAIHLDTNVSSGSAPHPASPLCTGERSELLKNRHPLP
jgi:hypothetical protein